MTVLYYMALGAGFVVAVQVCLHGAREMQDHDATEESWKSIMEMEDNWQ